MKKSAAIIAGALSLALAVPTSVSAAPEPSGTLADRLLADSATDGADGFDHRWWDFDIVTQAVLLFPDLVEAASNPDAELTVFLPNDNAFRILVHDLTGVRPDTEAEVFAAVASLGLDTVQTVLTYHIVGAKISYDAALTSDGAAVPTLLGPTVEVDVKNHGAFVKLIDNDPSDGDPRIVWPDIGKEALNGWAHGINRVLRPVDL